MNDLVKQAIAELRDVTRCRCMSAYTDRGLHDPSCECDSAEAVKTVADRIEKLEAENRELAMQVLAAEGQAADAYQAQKSAEAKLGRTVETLNYIGNKSQIIGLKAEQLRLHARAALAELKGGE